MNRASDTLQLRLHRDHLYIEADAFERHLAQTGSVALVREEDNLLIFPISVAAAGGFLVKQINRRGDRAIHAADFFRLNGIDDELNIILDARLNASLAGFVVETLFHQCK